MARKFSTTHRCRNIWSTNISLHTARRQRIKSSLESQSSNKNGSQLVSTKLQNLWLVPTFLGAKILISFGDGRVWVDWKSGLAGKKYTLSYTFIWFRDVKFACISFYFCFICIGYFCVCCRRPSLGKHEKSRLTNSQRPRLIRQLKH